MDYKKLFFAIPGNIVVLSTDYRVVDATDAYLRVTKRTREDLIGKNFLEAFPDNPDDEGSRNGVTLRRSLDNALHTKQVDHFPVARYDIPRPASEGGGFDLRYWEATHTPLLDDDGDVQYLIQHTTDVTERELTKQALNESENRFRFMAESMPMLINTSNADGEPDYFNQSWANYSGYSVSELIGDRWSELIHPDDVQAMRNRWQEVIRTGVDLQAEVRIRDKNGMYRWHITRSAPMRDENGEVLMWVSSSIDIHETRKIVQELVEVNEQAAQLSDQVQLAFRKAESERKALERIIMQAPAIFAVLKGPEHRFELVNPLFQALFPGKQLVGRTVAEALPEVEEQGFIQILDNVYRTGETFVADEQLFKLDRYSNGQLQDVYLSFSYQALYNEQNEVTGIFVFAYHVDEQVKLRQRLRDLGYAL